MQKSINTLKYLKETLNKRIMYYDGAMGTMIQVNICNFII